jgi:hypothetical protein
MQVPSVLYASVHRIGRDAPRFAPSRVLCNFSRFAVCLDERAESSLSQQIRRNTHLCQRRSFQSQTYHALANSSCWPSSVLIINFDEWGGFFDHVPPLRVVAPNTIGADLIGGRVLLGLSCANCDCVFFQHGITAISSRE